MHREGSKAAALRGRGLSCTWGRRQCSGAAGATSLCCYKLVWDGALCMLTMAFSLRMFVYMHVAHHDLHANMDMHVMRTSIHAC